MKINCDSDMLNYHLKLNDDTLPFKIRNDTFDIPISVSANNISRNLLQRMFRLIPLSSIRSIFYSE